ncbi:hypothetical protein DMB92_00545 [Campylobacter sp. MIT 99-7217]|uniref:hypothetical protein n=1 Tax=Campylobacter sp. MIT 99-7217 TaxID=535091 RepID=UPI001158251F|nr:hypothetical protein [Campylobacter sp. MIT 99-7217]TQR34488.1 hypothetical protein DMB92_00545 [Campylobacter sp. MIT 99-7217]
MEISRVNFAYQQILSANTEKNDEKISPYPLEQKDKIEAIRELQGTQTEESQEANSDPVSDTLNQLYKQLEQLYKQLAQVNSLARSSDDINMQAQYHVQAQDIMAQIVRVLGQILKILESLEKAG